MSNPNDAATSIEAAQDETAERRVDSSKHKSLQVDPSMTTIIDDATTDLEHMLWRQIVDDDRALVDARQFGRLIDC